MTTILEIGYIAWIIGDCGVLKLRLTQQVQLPCEL